jgi:hypothetical protein
MTVSAVSHYRGGTIDEVTPVARRLKAAYLKHGVQYRLSRFETGPNEGDWFVVVTYDKAVEEKRRQPLRRTPNASSASPISPGLRRGSVAR